MKITTLNISRLFETLGFCSSFINVLIGVLFTLAKSVLEARQELPLYLFFFALLSTIYFQTNPFPSSPPQICLSFSTQLITILYLQMCKPSAWTIFLVSL